MSGERWWNGYSRKARYIAKLTVVQPVKKFRTFYGYRRFGIEFVRARQWFLDSSECSSYLVIFRLLLCGGLVVPGVSKDHNSFCLRGLRAPLILLCECDVCGAASFTLL